MTDDGEAPNGISMSIFFNVPLHGLVAFALLLLLLLLLLSDVENISLSLPMHDAKSSVEPIDRADAYDKSDLSLLAALDLRLVLPPPPMKLLLLLLPLLFL